MRAIFHIILVWTVCKSVYVSVFSKINSMNDQTCCNNTNRTVNLNMNMLTHTQSKVQLFCMHTITFISSRCCIGMVQGCHAMPKQSVPKFSRMLFLMYCCSQFSVMYDKRQQNTFLSTLCSPPSVWFSLPVLFFLLLAFLCLTWTTIPCKFFGLTIEQNSTKHASKIFLQLLFYICQPWQYNKVSKMYKCLMKSIKTSVFYPQKQIATKPLKKHIIRHRHSTAKKNPSWEIFLKRMNSIDHTDGMLSERETERNERGEREIQTDTGRYIDGDVWDVEERKDSVVGRRDNRVKEDEEDERGMRFLFLSRAFIISIEFILVVSLSLVFLSCPSLSVSVSYPAQPLFTGVSVKFLKMLKGNSNDSPHKGHFIITAQPVKTVV